MEFTLLLTYTTMSAIFKPKGEAIHMGRKVYLKGCIINDVSYIPEFFGVTSCGITYRNKDYYVTTKNPERNLIDYIVDGKGYIECEGKLYKVSKGDTVVIRSRVGVKYYADNNDPYVKLWFTATGRFVEQTLELLMKNEKVAIVRKNSYDIIEKLLKSTEEKGADDKRDIHAFMDIIYLIFSPEQPQESGNHTDDHDFVDNIRSYFDLFFTEGITVEDAAAHFSVSQRYLIEQFKRKYNITPHKYITQKRMSRAKELLLSSNCTVSEISDHLGYCEPGYFTKIFTREIGISPNKYKKQASKE